MTISRLVPYSLHGALELATGLALMAAPFLLGFSAAGLVLSASLGALLVGLALSAATSEGRTVPIGAHFTFDRAIVLALLVGALAMSLHGDRAAAAALLAGSVAQLSLALTTRYSEVR